MMKFLKKPSVAAYKRDSRVTRDGWMEHLNGIDWFDADVPSRFHRCWPQTRGQVSLSHGLELVERCACGSLRFDGYGPWIDRNARLPR